MSQLCDDGNSSYIQREDSVFSVVYPVVCGLINSHLKPSDRHSNTIATFVEAVRLSLVARMKAWVSETGSHPAIVTAMLDPRYQTLSFWGSEVQAANMLIFLNKNLPRQATLIIKIALYLNFVLIIRLIDDCILFILFRLLASYNGFYVFYFSCNIL